MVEVNSREFFFDPKIMTLLSIAGIGGGIVVNAIIDVFGSSLYTPVLIFCVLTVIALFETWWLNFRYFPSL
jgi:hypothetical protein